MIRPNVAKLVKVGDNWICGITKFKIDMEDLDGEGTTRSENGTMHRERIREKVKKLFLTCTNDDEEVLAVAEMVQDTVVEMTVFCPGDPTAEDYYKTSMFYVSKISVELLNLSDGRGWWSVSFNAIEV